MDAMSGIMGQTIVSSNMTGGSGGSVGTSYCWEADHDGYTLCGTSETPLTIPVMTGIEQTSEDWLYFIAAGSPGVLCVNKDSGYDTLDSIVANLATTPESVSIAGTTGGLWFALAKLFDSLWQTFPLSGYLTRVFLRNQGCVPGETNCVVAPAG